MGFTAWIVLLVGAVVLGLIVQTLAQVMGVAKSSYEWLVTAVGAAIGGWVGTAGLGPWSAWGPTLDGMYILPALFAAIIVGVISDLLFRMEIRTQQPAV